MQTSPTPTRFLACVALAFGAASTGTVAVPAAAQPASETIGSIWQQHSNEPDVAWRDPTSHTRVVNLTSGFESASVFYFHQNIFTADGDLMLFSGKRGEDQGYFVLSLRTGAIRQVTHQTGQHLVVLPHRRAAAFDRGDDVFLLNMDSGETRKIATVPHGLLAQARASASPRTKASCFSPTATSSPTSMPSWCGQATYGGPSPAAGRLGRGI